MTQYVNLAVSQLATETDESVTMPTCVPQEDIFLSLVHVALNIRRDLMKSPGHEGFGIFEQYAIDCIPDSLFMSLPLLFGSQKVLDGRCCLSVKVLFME